jgi:hypothetical protein
MARHRTPIKKAALTGALAKNPRRYAERSGPESAGPLGDPPEFLSDAERAAWNDFRCEWAWLAYEDRASVAGLCQMRAVLEDATAEKNAAFYTAYRLMLSEHGGTPVSRSKIHQSDDEDEGNPFAAFGPPN